jgi:hypothetical protein
MDQRRRFISDCFEEFSRGIPIRSAVRFTNFRHEYKQGTASPSVAGNDLRSTATMHRREAFPGKLPAYTTLPAGKYGSSVATEALENQSGSSQLGCVNNLLGLDPIRGGLGGVVRSPQTGSHGGTVYRPGKAAHRTLLTMFPDYYVKDVADCYFRHRKRDDSVRENETAPGALNAVLKSTAG